MEKAQSLQEMVLGQPHTKERSWTRPYLTSYVKINPGAPLVVCPVVPMQGTEVQSLVGGLSLLSLQLASTLQRRHCVSQLRLDTAT